MSGDRILRRAMREAAASSRYAAAVRHGRTVVFVVFPPPADGGYPDARPSATRIRTGSAAFARAAIERWRWLLDLHPRTSPAALLSRAMLYQQAARNRARSRRGIW